MHQHLCFFLLLSLLFLCFCSSLGLSPGRLRQLQQVRLKGLVLLVVVLAAVVACVLVVLRQSSYILDVDDPPSSTQSRVKDVAPSVGPCRGGPSCPDGHFSFRILSGAANVVSPTICLEDKLVLGSMMNNAGSGINIVVLNGKTGQVGKTGYFNMYDGDVKVLIDFLQAVEQGSVLLMASYDDPANKLNDEARSLISDLGSSSIKVLGYRDSWVFVGGKGSGKKSNFEKHIKSDAEKNKYEGWPEMVELEGCIPKFLE